MCFCSWMLAELLKPYNLVVFSSTALSIGYSVQNFPTPTRYHSEFGPSKGRKALLASPILHTNCLIHPSASTTCHANSTPNLSLVTKAWDNTSPVSHIQYVY